jgi:hypothetical protein
MKDRNASKDQRNFISREVKEKAIWRCVRQDLESCSPELVWTSGFIVFYCQWEEYVLAQRFWQEQLSLGREMGYLFPWLSAIFGDHVDLPQSALQFHLYLAHGTDNWLIKSKRMILNTTNLKDHVSHALPQIV